MSRLMAVLASLLAIVIGFDGIFYWQQGQDLKDVLSRVDALSGQLTTLEASASSLWSDATGISGSLAALQSGVLVLESGVADLDTGGESAVGVVALAAPSVVRIVTTPSSRTPGTGIIITQDGYVLTNSHVIEGNSSITVTLASGESYPAGVVGDDAGIDLAVLKIDSSRSDFATAVFGSYEGIVTGQRVLAFGYPYSNDLGSGLSVTDGIVSSLKVIDGVEYIQTDCEISLGYGGGPLVNMDGEVIGLTTWTFTAGQGLKFAIPVNRLESFVSTAIGVIV